MSQSLWNFPQGEPVIGPVQMMREQGALLSDSTSGKLQSAIQTSGNGAEIVNDFNIVVPSLGFYQYTIGRYVQTPLALYPGKFYSPLNGGWIQIADEAEFRTALSRTLGSESARDLIKTLLSQVS